MMDITHVCIHDCALINGQYMLCQKILIINLNHLNNNGNKQPKAMGSQYGKIKGYPTLTLGFARLQMSDEGRAFEVIFLLHQPQRS